MATSDDIIAAVRRSELALVEQISQWESQTYGVAFWSNEFADSAAANQLRDVWLADVDGPTAYEQAEAFFAERGVVCRTWVPASGQAVEPIGAVLSARNWRREELIAWGLSSWDWVDAKSNPAIRVLPARAMPKAFRATFDDGATGSEERSALAAERLNDSHYDVFVAMLDGRPAGRIGYLQVGEIARLTDLYVLEAARGSGAARAMASHFLQLARRLLPKFIVAGVPSEDAGAQRFLSRFGFTQQGSIVQFVRG